MSSKAVKLRAHHGMCLAYFVGEGYSQGFAAHMAQVLASLTPETPVQLAAETDAVNSSVDFYYYTTKLESCIGGMRYYFGLREKAAYVLVTRIVHSTIAHGLVKTIDASRAERIPGVVKVFTCRFCTGAVKVPKGPTVPSSKPQRASTARS